uniref:TF_AP-2 domain-containing protein n=1 Tax=Caenorhabditis tropicalis TaxID=1561998 RepID=A0A1I7TA61_9PELO
MNLSTIYGFFRKSKKKECIVELKKTLCENNIEIPRMQRQRQLNCFSPILEEEAVQLAYDIEMLYKKYFPVADVGRQMLENLLKKGHTVEICEKMLTNTLAVMNQIIETLNSRQPKINGKDEKLKGTPLDVAYHVFSNSTHGFGHPNSLTHYRTYRDIVSHAILLSRKMLKGEPLLPIEKPDPNEKPFALMSDNEFMAMINGRVEKKPDINNIVN